MVYGFFAGQNSPRNLLREDKWMKPGLSSFFDAGKAPKCGFIVFVKYFISDPTGANLLGNSGSLVITTDKTAKMIEQVHRIGYLCISFLKTGAGFSVDSLPTP